MNSRRIAIVLLAWGGAAFAAGPGPAAELVDLNRASVKQLKTLPGIGDAQAEKIVRGRPYTSKTDLVTKDVLPLGVYLSLKNRVIAWQRVPPPVER